MLVGLCVHEIDARNAKQMPLCIRFPTHQSVWTFANLVAVVSSAATVSLYK